MSDDRAYVVYTGFNFEDADQMQKCMGITDELFEFLANYHMRYGIDKRLIIDTYDSIRTALISKITPGRLCDLASNDPATLLQEADYALCDIICYKCNKLINTFDKDKLKVWSHEAANLQTVSPRAPFYGSGVALVLDDAIGLLNNLQTALYDHYQAHDDRLILDYTYAATALPEPFTQDTFKIE